MMTLISAPTSDPDFWSGFTVLLMVESAEPFGTDKTMGEQVA